MTRSPVESTRCDQGDRSQPIPAAPVLSDRDFQKLSALVYEKCGIHLPPNKMTLLESRLQRRIRDLGLRSFDQYCDRLTKDASGGEVVQMIDLVTTNKTDFFREPNHYEYLTSAALPEIVREGGIGPMRPLRVWSAGCSTGEEPYTLSIVLSEYGAATTGFAYSVLATDISTRVLKAAALGIYDEERVAPVPPLLRKKYLMRSRDRGKAEIRISPALRAHVRFGRLNFMDHDYGIRDPFDVVFCRNVIICFDRPTQERVLGRIAKCMRRGAYIFTGHSETLLGIEAPLRQVAPTVYRRV